MSSQHRAIAITAERTVGVASVPTPAPGPGQVSVKVDSAVVGPFDTYQVDYGFFVFGYPVILGLAGSGTVTQIGEGARGLAVGDRVAFTGFDGGADRSLQEIAVLSDANVGKIPSSLSFEEAAAIPDNYISAWFQLCHSIGIPLSLKTPPANPNEAIFVYGSGSSVGQYAIQILKATGYTNVITTASPRHHDNLRKLGATHVFDYNSPNLTSEILGATGGSKIKYVFDCVTTQSSMKAIAAVVESGSKVGILLPIKEGTSVVGAKLHTSIPPEMNPYPAGVTVVPTSTFTYQQQREDLKDLMRDTFATMVADGTIKPNRVHLVDSGTLAERGEKALSVVNSGSAGGSRVVIKIAGAA